MSREPLQHDPHAVRWFTAYAGGAGALMVLIGLLVVAGWRWNIPVLMAVFPGQQSMKISTAMCFVLSGLALLVVLRPGQWRRYLSQFFSLVVALLGLAHLGEHLWQFDLGIDRIFDDPTVIRIGRPPGRMSEATAVAFFLLGIMGILASARRWLVLREMVAVILIAIAMLALAGYGFALAGETSDAFNPVAIHTAFLLLVGTLGWMSLRPTIGLTRVATADSLGGVFARRLLLPSLLLPVAFTFAFKTMQSQLGASEAFAFSLAALVTGGAMAGMVWWMATLLDRMERQRREADLLRDVARTDALTGLANRRAFDAALADRLRGRREDDTVFSLLMLDLDNFKAYNDDFGHLAGDEALRNTGAILRNALRPADFAARYGGEEFALILSGTEAVGAMRAAERIVADFRAFPWALRPVTVSIGVAEALEDDGSVDLVHRTDAALYQAKRNGRNRAILAPSNA